MKRVNLLVAVPYVLVLSLPLILASCAAMPSFSGDSRDSANYYSTQPVITSSTTQVTTTGKTAKTTMVEPGVSTVVMPKPTPTVTTVVPKDAPMVPGTAPSVGN